MLGALLIVILLLTSVILVVTVWVPRFRRRHYVPLADGDPSIDIGDLQSFCLLFESADANGDGQLDFQEFIVCLNSLGITHKGLGEMLFKAFDRDGDGRVNVYEFLGSLAVLTAGTVDAKIQWMFHLFNRKRDGLLSRDDVHNMVRTLRAATHSLDVPTLDESAVNSMTDTLFNQMDKESKGSVTMSEFREAALSKRKTFQLLGLAPIHESHDGSSAIKDRIMFGNNNISSLVSIMCGVAWSVQTTRQHPSKLELSDFCLHRSMRIGDGSSHFVEYAPTVFVDLRRMAGISEADYARSLGATQLLAYLLVGRSAGYSPRLSEGSSGSTFYQTYDGQFILKEIDRKEWAQLLRILPEYHAHLNAHPKSLLPRFFGLYVLISKPNSRLGRCCSICLPTSWKREIQGIPFVVMSNVFRGAGSCSLLRFDLKGAQFRRTVFKRQFNINQVDKLMMDGDLLNSKIQIAVPNTYKHRLLTQLQEDTKLLSKLGLYDYSLLVGVKKSDAQNTISPPASPLASENWYRKRRESLDIVETVGTNQTIYLGLVDCLTPYTCWRKLQRAASVLVTCGRMEVSACPPERYSTRLVRFVASIITGIE